MHELSRSGIASRIGFVTTLGLLMATSYAFIASIL